MTGDELQAFVKETEVIFSGGDNVYDFATGRQLSNDEVDTLIEVEKWELAIALDEWC